MVTRVRQVPTWPQDVERAGSPHLLRSDGSAPSPTAWLSNLEQHARYSGRSAAWCFAEPSVGLTPEISVSVIQVLPSPGSELSLDRRASSFPLPSLDPDESNPRTGSQSDIAFRHSWWRDDRRRIRSALETVFPDSKRILRFLSCGDAAWIFRSNSDPSKLKICCDSCRDRWCRACQRDRSRIIAANLRDRLKDASVKLVTLTLQHRFQPLRSQVDRLLESFCTLRRKPLWTGSIEGGVAFVEVTYNADTNRWHPHLHILCVGSWLSQATLSATWDQITGGSFIVDVRRVHDVDQVASYVVKYATKPMNAVLYRHPAKLVEAVRALQGRHLCLTFGTFRGWRLTESTDGDEWTQIGTLESFQCRARDGDWEAMAVLDALRPADLAEKPAGRPP